MVPVLSGIVYAVRNELPVSMIVFFNI